MKNIIGKTYIANDNSYSINLTYSNRDCRLAGCYISKPKLAKIVSEPYTFRIKSNVMDEGFEHKFINVEYNGDIFRVLYNERNINASLSDRIKSHNELREMYDGLM
ncbi:hypothetical protein Nekkels1_27 [Cellulophaga phage Nekkels_1]|uniref:Uncharacterized protein n=1 Tax=Cellulophaga phage Nekkels_1 TaxID=2745692 RepID=A0A8E4UXF9_9CAUD|nr:hypothetical protein M1M31_gp27 [Cellulophaga phage Nekkels_1]QQO97027.1 hypothetical protein Nekkels1_27 [Cellulophaga phage Nekkels_1]QQO97120.1 hypothetical protein Nekkels2_27 [Cellulophaga phage Nekkels_2]